MMPILPRKKVGLISCSGEEFPEGTLARMATLRVLEKVRPNDTVTLCLPLFLAGNDKERAFARFYPRIAIDGCEKRCAARATEMYSAKPTASLVIPEFLQAHALKPPRSRRRLDADGERAAEALAKEIAARVDDLLGVTRESPDAAPAIGGTPPRRRVQLWVGDSSHAPGHRRQVNRDRRAAFALGTRAK